MTDISQYFDFSSFFRGDTPSLKLTADACFRSRSMATASGIDSGVQVGVFSRCPTLPLHQSSRRVATRPDELALALLLFQRTGLKELCRSDAEYPHVLDGARKLQTAVGVNGNEFHLSPATILIGPSGNGTIAQADNTAIAVSSKASKGTSRLKTRPCRLARRFHWSFCSDQPSSRTTFPMF